MARIGVVQAGSPQLHCLSRVALLALAALTSFASQPVAAAPDPHPPPPPPPGASIALGESLFERNCVPCHGIGGKGGRGPNLARPQLARAPDDAALKALIEHGIPPEMPDGTFFTDEDIASLVLYVRSLGQVPAEPIQGEPARGATLFVRAGCPSCHVFKGRGQGFGPDLSDIAERRSASYIRAAIEEPAAHLPTDFLWVSAQLHAGAVVKGIRLNEDSFTIQLKDATGVMHSWQKSDLVSLERLEGQTPMPAFAKILSSTELDDLVAFIASPKAPSPSASSASASSPPASSPPAVAADHASQVPFERLVAADREPGNWISYSRNLLGQRFSPLTEITPENVQQLKVKWTYQFADPNNEASPWCSTASST
jgi:cytochrome c oxidase cbb3-type subunit 3